MQILTGQRSHPLLSFSSGLDMMLEFYVLQVFMYIVEANSFHSLFQQRSKEATHGGTSGNPLFHFERHGFSEMEGNNHLILHG